MSSRRVDDAMRHFPCVFVVRLKRLIWWFRNRISDVTPQCDWDSEGVRIKKGPPVPHHNDTFTYQGVTNERKPGAICRHFGRDRTSSLTTGTSAFAQKKYDTGASDTEIKIGNIMPYSGPASAYGIIGKTEQAYFNKINAAGGINGRKINLSRTTMPTARPRLWSRLENSWKAMKFSWSSIRSARRRIRQSTNT